MDYSQISILDCADSKPKKCDCLFIDDFKQETTVLNDGFKQVTEAYPDLETSCRPSKCCLLESEILDIRAQLENLQATIEDMVKSHGQCYVSLAQDYRMLSRDYEKTSNKIVEKQMENIDMQNTLHCKKGIEFQTVKDITQLECVIAKTMECNKILENKIHKEQMVVNSLEQQLVCTEKSIARRKVQAEGLQCEAETEKNALCRKKSELQDLRDRNVERCREVRELTAEHREREVALATVKESGPVALAAAAQSVDVARMALSDTCDAAADWVAKRARTDEEHEQARLDGDAQRCCAQATLRDLAEEQDRLANCLTETIAQLTTAKNDRRLMGAKVKANADRMACLRAETEHLKQRAHHKNSVQASQQANVEAEAKSIEDQRSMDCRLLAMANSEVEALKLASSWHEKAIKNARQKLQDHCSMMTYRH